MSQETLDKFFSPITAKDSKRRRSSSSPDLSDKKLLRMDKDSAEIEGGSFQPSFLNEIKVMMKSMNEQISKLATKEDIGKLEEKIERVLTDNEKMTVELAGLKEENKQLRDRVGALENRVRRNNLIFRGVPDSADYEQAVKDICRNVLGLQEEVSIVQAFPISKSSATSENKVVLAEFLAYKDVLKINAKLRNIKDTGLNIHQDFEPETRLRRAKLLALRREVKRTSPNLRIRLRTDMLLVTGNNGHVIKLKWGDEHGLRTTDGKDGMKALAELTGSDFSNFFKEGMEINAKAHRVSSQHHHRHS
uniref:Uncharacterized protein n=1 Tax=Rhodnius prolixus TaxID=13249 RepID=T1IFC9_RHOPR